MLIRKAMKKDIYNLVGMALLIWTNSSEKELFKEFEGMLQDDECAIYIATEGNDDVGFAQVGLRHDYVEGTKSSPVGYLEGIFVKEGYRHKGFAQSLLYNCETWAKKKSVLNLPVIANLQIQPV